MNTSSIIDAAWKLCNEVMKDYDASHDVEHVKRVVRLARYLANEESIIDKDTLEIIELASILHDVGDYKYKTENSIGVSAIEDMFKEYNYPEDKTKRVLHVINNVGFSSELKRIDQERIGNIHDKQCESTLPMYISLSKRCYEFPMSQSTDIQFVQRDPDYHTPELCVVQDADRLEALGGIGISRCLFFTAARRGLIHDPDVTPDDTLTANRYVKQQNGSKRNASITHFYEKIFKLQSLMKTEKGKEMAIERTKIMYNFVHAVENEWNFGL